MKKESGTSEGSISGHEEEWTPVNGGKGVAGNPAGQSNILKSMTSAGIFIVYSPAPYP
jgi:hypothetical protein